MQLYPFNFSKNPVEEMDGWIIWVARKNEDIETGEKVKETPEEITVNKELQDLVDEYYDDLEKIFTNFFKNSDITTFEELYKDKEQETNLVKLLKILFIRNGESNETAKAKEIVKNLNKFYKFKELLKKINEEKLKESNAQKLAQEEIKKAKSRITITTGENAEEKAQKTITKEKIRKIKQQDKSDFMKQILNDTINTQERKLNRMEENGESVNPALNDLLQNIALEYVNKPNKNNVLKHKKYFN